MIEGSAGPKGRIKVGQAMALSDSARSFPKPLLDDLHSGRTDGFDRRNLIFLPVAPA